MTLVDVHVDIDVERAVCVNWGVLSKGFRAPFKGFGADARKVSSLYEVLLLMMEILPDLTISISYIKRIGNLVV